MDSIRFLAENDLLSEFENDRPHPSAVDFMTVHGAATAICQPVALVAMAGVYRAQVARAAALRGYYAYLYRTTGGYLPFDFRDMEMLSVLLECGELRNYNGYRTRWAEKVAVALSKGLTIVTMGPQRYREIHAVVKLPAGVYDALRNEWVVPCRDLALRCALEHRFQSQPEPASVPEATLH